ncbi:MAG: hypothetical protein ABI551_08445 [Polyangiaceae bacterium]
MRPRLFVTFASIAAFTYACGGVDSASVSGSGGDDDDTSTTHDAGSHDASVTGRDGGGSVTDGGGGVDDAGGGKRDGGGPKDSGGGGSAIPATCGTQTDAATVVCNTTTPTCCANQQVYNGTVYSCTSTPSACTGTETTPVQCRDDRDCNGGKVCCGVFNNVYDSLQCVPAAQCIDDGGFTQLARFCTPTAADPCPGLGQTCSASTLLPGFDRCF